MREVADKPAAFDMQKKATEAGAIVEKDIKQGAKQGAEQGAEELSHDEARDAAHEEAFNQR